MLSPTGMNCLTTLHGLNYIFCLSQLQIIVLIFGTTIPNAVIGLKLENVTGTRHGWHNAVTKHATIVITIVETNTSRKNACSGQIWVNVTQIRNGCIRIAHSLVAFALVVSSGRNYI